MNETKDGKMKQIYDKSRIAKLNKQENYMLKLYNHAAKNSKSNLTNQPSICHGDVWTDDVSLRQFTHSLKELIVNRWNHTNFVSHCDRDWSDLQLSS